jgi:hypothetical protein
MPCAQQLLLLLLLLLLGVRADASTGRLHVRLGLWPAAVFLPV